MKKCIDCGCEITNEDLILADPDGGLRIYKCPKCGKEQ